MSCREYLALREVTDHLVADETDVAIRKLVVLLRKRQVGAIGCLGTLYLAGWGVPMNLARAERYLELAARRGDALSAHNLAEMFMTALTHRPDHREQAERWEAVARANGFDPALAATLPEKD